ncbi:hypothetical protein [Leptospira interrogans]|nr:hypothetical protein [Leptospira interrogans]
MAETIAKEQSRIKSWTKESVFYWKNMKADASIYEFIKTYDRKGLTQET